MRRSSRGGTRTHGRARSRIQLDLESKGLGPECSEVVAQRLVEVAAGLTQEEYAAVLDGVSSAYGARRSAAAALFHDDTTITELQRLMQGFSDELRKLDEGLRILSAYVTRMRSRAARDDSPSLH